MMLVTETEREVLIRACDSKTAFLSKDEANRTIHNIRKHRGQNMAAYRCQLCECWHLTTQKSEKS